MNDQPGRLPFSPPERPLEYWLSPELSRVSPEDTRSRLREIAGARDAYMGAWAAGIGMGAELILLGVFLGLQLDTPAPTLGFGIPGFALAVFCNVFYVRIRDRVPRTGRSVSHRGPGSLRQALSFVGFILFAFIAVFAFAAKPAPWQDPSRLLPLAMTLVFVIGLMVAAIVVPATIMGRARESLRRKAMNDPRFRDLLEQDLLTWRDPVGNASYGLL
ncbi:hypothetical protein ACFYZN_25255 [Streptomyces sp. NPDC001777]|uniref:hypothetical protein n=1 Tax=Streptomyces sp. NPDC001777 TaxID=3364608 RepID=UPI00367D278B